MEREAATPARRYGEPLALLLTGLTKSFGGQRALDNVTLEVAQGEVHGLLGQNGSGKSTLIKILAGFHAPDPGAQLTICGSAVPLPLSPGAFRRYRISFVHQHLGLIPTLSVLENLLIGRLSQRHDWAIDWAGARRQAVALFREYGVALDPSAPVADLSPIQRALLAIVRATAEMGPPESRNGDALPDGTTANGLLVLDEPTPFLPRRDVDQLFGVVRAVVSRGASAIFVSHDVDEIMEITDRATILRDGKVAARLQIAQASREDLIEAIIGRRLAQAGPATEPARDGPPRASVTGLTGATLRNLDLDLMPGEILGLTGLIGAGFDDVPYLLYGARRGSGRLRLDDDLLDLASLTPADAIRHGIVLIPADRSTNGVIGTLPVADNVTMPVLNRYRRWGLRRRGMMQDARALGRRFDVRPPDPSLRISALSGGNQQKVLLAKWLQRSPRLVLLDEPTQGIDIGARQTIFGHIRAAAAAGACVLCASSDYEQLASLCSRVLIFSAGRVVAHLRGAEITKTAIAERSLGGAAMPVGS